jgi:hypothetical protein
MRVLRFVVNTTDGLVVRLLSAPGSIARRSQLQGQPAVGGLIHGPEEPIPSSRRSRREQDDHALFGGTAAALQILRDIA